MSESADGRNVMVSEAGRSRDGSLDDGAPGTDRFDDAATVTLPSGAVMPAFGFGTWQLEDDAAYEMVTAALERDVRHIDTAQMYGNEHAVGRALADSGRPRDGFWVTTKIADDHHEPDALVASVEASLERLDLPQIDLLLLHWPVDYERIGATLSAMAQVHAGGLTRHIGVSNFTIEQLDQVADLAPLEVLQCECHPFLQQVDLRRWCADRGWGFTAYSPIAQGDVLDDEVLQQIADDRGTSPVVVALSWLLSQRGVSVIPRTSDVEHLEANLAARDLRLGQEELDRIGALDEGRRLVDPDRAPW